jgi:hypothetical protein
MNSEPARALRTWRRPPNFFVPFHGVVSLKRVGHQIQPIIQAASHQHMLRVFRRRRARDPERPRQTHVLHREFLDVCAQVRRSTWFCESAALSLIATGVKRFLMLSAARQQKDGRRLTRAQDIRSCIIPLTSVWYARKQRCTTHIASSLMFNDVTLSFLAIRLIGRGLLRK